MGLKTKVIGGMAWSFAERFLAQIVSFVVSIILARILTPEAYGEIAMLLVFINIANVFATAGFGNALIQKKDADNLDFATVFYFNLVFSICIYFGLFLVAPFISEFYSMPGLTPVIRVLGLRIIVASVNSVQRAFVSREMLFRKFFFATLGGTILSAVVGIILAYLGFGIWALVAQYMTNTVTDTIVLWFTVKWRPIIGFSFNRLKSLFSYGWKLLCASLLSTLSVEINELMIGKYYGAADLSYYDKGNKFPQLVVTQINTSIKNIAIVRKAYNLYRIKKSIRARKPIIKPVIVSRKEWDGVKNFYDEKCKLLLQEIEDYKAVAIHPSLYGKVIIGIDDVTILSKYGDYLGPVCEINGRIYKMIKEEALADFKNLWDSGILQVFSMHGFIPRLKLSEYSILGYPILIECETIKIIPHTDIPIDKFAESLLFVSFLQKVCRQVNVVLVDPHYFNYCFTADKRIVYFDIGSFRVMKNGQFHDDYSMVSLGCYRLLFSYFPDSLLYYREYDQFRLGMCNYQYPDDLFEFRYFKRKYLRFHFFHSSRTVFRAARHIFDDHICKPEDLQILFTINNKCIGFMN